jgi:hypothetical protein
MAEILGLGLTHKPPMLRNDGFWSFFFQVVLADPGMPEALRDPANWPERLRAEWSTDKGEAAAGVHRAELLQEFRRSRQALRDFNPDLVVVWGDDQYDNFKEDGIPAFSVLAYEDLTFSPWEHDPGMNIWGENSETMRTVRGHYEAAVGLTSSLINNGIDVMYAYQPRHHPNFSHAFLNTILLLDYDRTGFDYPVIAFPVNCFGSRVISGRGFRRALDDVRNGTGPTPDPPGPTPQRCMDVGAATARFFRDSPYRVALIGSSSWSHLFLNDKDMQLVPDHAADQILYDSLEAGNLDPWRATTSADIENAGHQELLNWFCLVGAMAELGRPKPDYLTLKPTSLFTASSVFAEWKP